MNVSTVAGTVDFLREMADGKRGGAYMRVFPRVLGGQCRSDDRAAGAQQQSSRSCPHR